MMFGNWQHALCADIRAKYGDVSVCRLHAPTHSHTQRNARLHTYRHTKSGECAGTQEYLRTRNVSSQCDCVHETERSPQAKVKSIISFARISFKF